MDLNDYGKTRGLTMDEIIYGLEHHCDSGVDLEGKKRMRLAMEKEKNVTAEFLNPNMRKAAPCAVK